MVGFIQHVLRSVLSVLSRLRGEALKLANAAPTHRGESERERSCILATMYASDLLGELVGAARFVHCPAERALGNLEQSQPRDMADAVNARRRRLFE